MKFKVGDRVRILDQNHAPVNVGDIAKVVSVDEGPETAYPFKIEVENPRPSYEGLGWIFSEDQLELVESAVVKTELVGVKHDAGKAPVTLVPTEAIIGMAKVFAFGAKKYGRHNFRKGMDHCRVLDAAQRHLLAITDGEDIDPESGLPHWAHALCSLAMYAYMKSNNVGLDDRFIKEIEVKNG